MLDDAGKEGDNSATGNTRISPLSCKIDSWNGNSSAAAQPTAITPAIGMVIHFPEAEARLFTPHEDVHTSCWLGE